METAKCCIITYQYIYPISPHHLSPTCGRWKGHLVLFSWPSVDDGSTVYPKKNAHGFCFAVLCCGYTLTDFPISIRLTSLALWQSNDCPSASKATLKNMDKYFMRTHYGRLHNHNKAKHNKTVCIFLGIYCTWARKHRGRIWRKLPSDIQLNCLWRIASRWGRQWRVFFGRRFAVIGVV